MTLQEISKKIMETKGKIAIFGHVHPDCDAMGSMTALAAGLSQKGKQCDLFVDGNLNESQNKIYEQQKVNDKSFIGKNYTLCVVLDMAEPYRLGKYEEEFKKVQDAVRIDHHQGINDFVEDAYVDVKSSSTCEIMYDLLKIMGVDIHKQIATYLYSGIATDTNSFLNPNVRANTYKVAEELFNKGADVALVNKVNFRSISRSGLELTKILYKKLKFAINGKLAYVVINQKDFKKSYASYMEAENFSQMLDAINGVNIAVCATEREKGLFKLSIRSNNGENDYALRLAKSFKGGGHNQAAGASIKAKTDKQVEKVLIKNADVILGK